MIVSKTYVPRNDLYSYKLAAVPPDILQGVNEIYALLLYHSKRVKHWGGGARLQPRHFKAGKGQVLLINHRIRLGFFDRDKFSIQMHIV
jgi:hypothetical protein